MLKLLLPSHVMRIFPLLHFVILKPLFFHYLVEKCVMSCLNYSDLLLASPTLLSLLLLLHFLLLLQFIPSLPLSPPSCSPSLPLPACLGPPPQLTPQAGNDFLPNVPSIDIYDSPCGLDLVMAAYKELLPKMGGHLTDGCGGIVTHRLHQLLSRLARDEEAAYARRAVSRGSGACFTGKMTGCHGRSGVFRRGGRGRAMQQLL
jgi:hypothetical protein